MILPIMASGGLVYAFEKSTFEGRAVIICLVLGSIFSWSVMISKYIQIRRAKAGMESFMKKFRVKRQPLAAYFSGEKFPDAPVNAVYQAGCRELILHLTGSTEVDDTLAMRIQEADKLSTTAMGAVRSSVEREVGVQGLLLEDQMILLATAVSGAPFLGLLGTVWGVMDTFTGVAMAGKASIQAMAPGVSGALITTVTGLLVAIPAMFGYNYLVVSVRRLTIEVDNFASELMASLEHWYLKSK